MITDVTFYAIRKSDRPSEDELVPEEKMFVHDIKNVETKEISEFQVHFKEWLNNEDIVMWMTYGSVIPIEENDTRKS